MMVMVVIFVVIIIPDRLNVSLRGRRGVFVIRVSSASASLAATAVSSAAVVRVSVSLVRLELGPILAG